MSLQIRKLGSNHYVVDPGASSDHGAATSGTIKEVIDSLPSTGGLIQLLGGTYYFDQRIDINKDNVTIRGTPRAMFILNEGLRIYNPNVTIENMRFGVAGAGDTARITIYPTGLSACIKNCIHGSFAYGSGIAILDGAHDAKIIGNTFGVEAAGTYLNAGAVSADNSDQIVIRNNKFYNAGSSNVTLDDCQRSIVSGNLFYSSSVNEMRMLYLINSGNTIINNNHFIKSTNDQTFPFVYIKNSTVVMITGNNFEGGSLANSTGIHWDGGNGAHHYNGNQFSNMHKECQFNGLNWYQVGNLTELSNNLPGFLTPYAPSIPHYARQYSY